jgi:hypothetical protein
LFAFLFDVNMLAPIRIHVCVHIGSDLKCTEGLMGVNDFPQEIDRFSGSFRIWPQSILALAS